MSAPNCYTTAVVQELRSKGALIDVSTEKDFDVVSAVGRERYITIESSGIVSLSTSAVVGGDFDADSFVLSDEPAERREQILKILLWLL